jgi:LemA protein
VIFAGRDKSKDPPPTADNKEYRDVQSCKGGNNPMLSAITTVLAALAVVGLVLYVVGFYNSGIALDHTAAKEFANIESIMKQRHDELPKLVDACKAYMAHEQGVLATVNELRSAYQRAHDREEKVQVENALNRGVGAMRVVVEKYPELKANAQFEQINTRISALESILNNRREQFNQAVTHYNVFIGQFPALLLAPLFGWRGRSLLDTSGAETADNFPTPAES